MNRSILVNGQVYQAKNSLEALRIAFPTMVNYARGSSRITGKMSNLVSHDWWITYLKDGITVDREYVEVVRGSNVDEDRTFVLVHNKTMEEAKGWDAHDALWKTFKVCSIDFVRWDTSTDGLNHSAWTVKRSEYSEGPYQGQTFTVKVIELKD